jgi:tetratricopeptide (TPR) repeat protein
MNDLALQEIADGLHAIGRESQTGVLRISVGGHVRMAFFEEGALVYAVSDAEGEDHASCFSRPGRFERPEARAELARLGGQSTRTRPLVTLVRESRLVDDETLRAWLVEHAYAVFAGALASRSASVKFTSGIRATHPLPYRIPISQLLLEAVGRIRNPELIREAIGPLEYYAEPSELYAARIAALPLSFHDGRIAALVESPMAIQEIVAISGLPEIDALRALLSLRTVGILAPFYEYRLTDTGKLRRRKAALESGVAVDVEAAAAALGFKANNDGHAVTIGELDGSSEAAPSRSPNGSPNGSPAPHKRGDTTRLNLLSSAYIGMAEAEAASGNYAAAAQCYETALADRPGDLQVLLAYAAMHAKRPNGLSSAEELLERAAEANPRSASPFVALARIYHAANRHDDAEDALLDARRLEPNSAEVRAVAEQIASRGGFFSKLGLRKEAPPRSRSAERSSVRSAERSAERPAVRSADRSASVPAAPRPAPPPGAVALRCRHCGRSFDHKVHACPSCGATL